jgi:hypothetical protein
MMARALDGPEVVRRVSVLLALTGFLYVRVVIAAAAPVTLTCPDAGGSQTFLLDLDNANVISATGIWRDSGRPDFLFRNAAIHTTETSLTWQWSQEGKVRTYVLDRNTLDLQITDRARPGWAVGRSSSGKLLQELSFHLQCILSRRQL